MCEAFSWQKPVRSRTRFAIWACAEDMVGFLSRCGQGGGQWAPVAHRQPCLRRDARRGRDLARFNISCKRQGQKWGGGGMGGRISPLLPFTSGLEPGPKKGRKRLGWSRNHTGPKKRGQDLLPSFFGVGPEGQDLGERAFKGGFKAGLMKIRSKGQIFIKFSGATWLVKFIRSPT